MTRSIHADLLAAQKKMAYEPSIEITFSDNGLPHPILWDNNLTNYSANPTASVRTTNYIIRAHRVAGTGVQVQRISDPTNLAQWEAAWTTIDAGGIYPALFWTGVRVVLVYQDASSKAIKFRTSSDEGATWSGATTIWTPSFFLNNTGFGLSGGTTRSGFCYAETTNLHFMPYNHAADTFPSDYAYAASATVGASHGIYLSGDNYLLALNLVNYATWTDSAIILVPMQYDATGAPTYGTKTLYNGVHGGAGGSPAYQFNYPHLAYVPPPPGGAGGGRYWLTYTTTAVAANGALYDNDDTVIAVSDDGAYFTAGLRLQQVITDRLQVHQWSAGGTVYLHSDRLILRSVPVATVTVPHADVKALDIEDFGATAYADITLDNRAGTYTALRTGRLGCDISIERGAVIAGTARRVARETFIASRFTREEIGNTVSVRAFNYHRLLSLWKAELPYYWASTTLGKLVEAIAALAGVHSASFDASSIWSTSIAEFFIQPGQTGADALASLQDQFQFVSRMSTATNLESLVLSASPAADYTFSSSQHQTILIEDDADRTAPPITHAEVIGSNAGAQAVAAALQAEMGRQFTYRVERQMLTANADCLAAATAIVNKATKATERARVVCLPAFHLQPFDAVATDDWSTATVRHVTALRETYNPTRKETLSRKQQNWRQSLTLAALTRGAGGRDTADSPDTIVPQGLMRSDFRRGRLISFDSSTWKALVFFAGTGGAVELPVARQVHPATMIAGRSVAVIQFDITNPADAIVLGTFTGTTSLWAPFDNLTAADGNPLKPVYTDAAGRLKADYGLDVTGTLTTTQTLTLSNDASLSARQTSLADDVATSFTPPNEQGIMLVYNRTNPGAATGGLIEYRANASPYCYGLLLAANTVVSTGALTNGTGDGTDAKLNVNTHTDGKIYLKNRLGGTHSFGVVFLGN